MTTQKKVEELFDRSNLLADRNDFEGAIRVLSEVIQLSLYPPAFVNRAMCYIDLIRSNESYSEKEIRPLLLKAKDDFTKAIELYERTPAGNNRSETLSVCFYERGKINKLLGSIYTGAGTMLDKVDWSNKSDVDEIKSKLFNNDTKLLQQAVNDANESIKHNRNNILAYSLKGDIYEAYFDDPKIAIEQYSKAISINATSLDYFKRSWCNYLIGNIRDASSDYQRATKLGLDEYDTETLRWSALKNGKGNKWTGFLQEMG